MDRNGLSPVEILVILVLLFILAVIFLPLLAIHETDRSWRHACVNNLKQLGLALDLYASEHDGHYPPIDETKNNFIFDANCLYPEYLSNALLLACPSDPETDLNRNFRLRSNEHHPGAVVDEVHPDCITDMSYGYLGWMLMNETEAIYFFKAYDMMSPVDYDTDITLPEDEDAVEPVLLHRLSTGVERFLIKDINTILTEDAPGVVPVMWDQVSTNIADFSHIPPGQNVLYLDGHVDFHRYDLNTTVFPVSPMCAALFGGHPRAPIPDCEETEH